MILARHSQNVKEVGLIWNRQSTIFRYEIDLALMDEVKQNYSSLVNGLP